VARRLYLNVRRNVGSRVQIAVRENFFIFFLAAKNATLKSLSGKHYLRVGTNGRNPRWRIVSMEIDKFRTGERKSWRGHWFSIWWRREYYTFGPIAISGENAVLITTDVRYDERTARKNPSKRLDKDGKKTADKSHDGW